MIISEMVKMNKRKFTQIQIPNPCAEKWEGMTPDANGRFCGSCQKTVTDFTSMNDVEITNYFKKPVNKKICGHFLKSQVKSSDVKKSMLERIFKHFISHHQNFTLKSFTYFFASFVIAIAGCKPNRNTTTGKASQIEADTTKICSGSPEIVGKDSVQAPDHSERIMGKIAYPYKKPSKINE